MNFYCWPYRVNKEREVSVTIGLRSYLSSVRINTRSIISTERYVNRALQFHHSVHPVWPGGKVLSW